MGIVINFPFVLRPARQVKFVVDAKSNRSLKRVPPRRTLRSNYDPRRDDPFLWSFAMSHSLQKGKNRGILDGITDFACGDLKRRLLKASSRWYLHPLHVPVVLLGVFFDHAAWEVNRLCKVVAHFESLSRDAGIGSLDNSTPSRHSYSTSGGRSTFNNPSQNSCLRL